jgi:type II secretory pathway pseudopilin PulG
VRARRRGESGTALVMALLVLFLLSIALALLAESLQLRMRLARDETEAVVLGSLSDSALEEAMAELQQDPNYTGTSKHDFGGGTIKSVVEPLGSPGLYDITGTATYAGHRRVVEIQVFRSGGGVSVRHWRRVPG